MRKKIQEIGKVKSLIKQFDFLKTFIGNFNQSDNIVNIQVKIADTNLLDYVAVEHDGIKSYPTYGKMKAKVTVRIITAYDYSTRQSKVSFSTWDNFPSNIYDIVKIVKETIPLEKVKSITILTIYDWYHIDDKYAESKLHIDKYFTVYNIINGGLKGIIDEVNLLKSVVLDSENFKINNSLSFEKYDKLNFDLKELTNNFLYSVYLRGLRDFIEESGEFALSGKFGNIYITSKKNTRKYNIRIFDFNSNISFIANEDDNPRMRIKEFKGTLPELTDLVNIAISCIKISKKGFLNTFEKRNYSTL